MKEIIPKINGWILVAIAALILVVYNLLSPGMFFDGLTYASIAENYNPGSFWELHYTETLKHNFYEHPPLSFFLLHLFLQIGLNEEIFSFVMLLLSFFIISRIYLLLDGSRNMSWLPSLLFIGTPVVFWSFSNNMLENTLTVFILLNIWFTLFLLVRNKETYYFILSGIVTVLCFLVKGPVGLFPIVIVPLYWIIFNEKKEINVYIKKFIYLVGGIFILVLIFLFSENARDFFHHYFNEQIVASISGQRETSGSRFFIFYKLILELLIMFGVTGILYMIGFRSNEYKKSIFFFGIGLFASLPLLISAKQMGFYIVPSIPFFALAFTFLINDKWMEVLKSIILTIIFGLGFIVLLPLVINNSLINKRDQVQLELVNTFSEMYVSSEIISYSEQLKNDWPLHAYLYRYCKISLDTKNNYRFLIIKKDETIPNNYTLLREYEKYILCRRKK